MTHASVTTRRAENFPDGLPALFVRGDPWSFADVRVGVKD